MPFSGLYPCIDRQLPIRLLYDTKVAHPSTGTKVFIEVQVREKRVYRTNSGLLLDHLHVSHMEPPNKYLSSWRLFQIDFDDLLAEDVFHHCCDLNSLYTMFISKNVHSAARFLNFFKRRVSLFCKNIAAAKLVETKPKSATILTYITTVCLVDLGEEDESEAEHSLSVCNKNCIPMKEISYGATRLPTRAFLLSSIHGSLALEDFLGFHGQTCAICLDELKERSDIIKICCGHAFHSRCLIPWFNKVGTCPICRFGMRLYITRAINQALVG